MPHIVVEALKKTFFVSERSSGLFGSIRGFVQRKTKEVHALKGISFSVEQGELVGYIGPNGAGKSTTIKILSGILVPDSGKCIIGGRTPWKDRIKHVGRIGVVFGQRTQLWWDLPVIESFDLLRDIYRVPNSQYRKTREEMIDLLDLSGFLSTPVRQLSLGQRMRCDFAAAMLHYYDLLSIAEISWKKSQKNNPKSDADLVKKKREEIIDFLSKNQAEIETGRLVVFFVDECHLLGDDVCGYVWGPTKTRVEIPVKNIKDRQTPAWCLRCTK